MITLTARDVLPEDGTSGTLAGRVWLPDAGGPAVVAVRGDGVFDVSASFATVSALCEQAKAARPAMQAWLPALRPALIFECVGIPGLIQQVFEGAPRDARIVVVGVCMETDRTEPMLGIMKELNVQYVLGYTPDEFARSLRLIADGEVDAASMVTSTVGIDGVAQAFADLANPERHTKIIVEPWR